MFSKTEKSIYGNMAFGKDRTDMLSANAEKSAFEVLVAGVRRCRDRDIRKSQEVQDALETLGKLNYCSKRILRFRQALDDVTPVGRFYRAKAALRSLCQAKADVIDPMSF